MKWLCRGLVVGAVVGAVVGILRWARTDTEDPRLCRSTYNDGGIVYRCCKEPGHDRIRGREHHHDYFGPVWG